MVRKDEEKRSVIAPAEDPKTLAAIQRGICDADEGRVTPIDVVRAKINKWTSKSSSQTKR
jgi:predicted transcriptional regulator